MNTELLAPAGSKEALEAAVNAGADAVYLGGADFGARAYASNFDRETMKWAVYFAHMHRVRIYVTVNTLVDDREMKPLADYLVFLNNVGVDGIIVQDWGVLDLARKIVPDLPRHASTQMTITNTPGVRFAASQSIERVVPAREMTLQDLDKMCDGETEIESFIHGALCICYSGQCLMSSLIGGRSGNRGRCAQPCRLPYTLVDKNGETLLSGDDAGKYLLSPKDLNTLSVLPQMMDAGVCSYKIEGRMKRPEYVAIVVDAYRRAMDSYKAGNYSVPEEDLANIEQVFNRDFTTAYLEKPQGKNMMSDRRPNNRGVLIGRVQSIDKKHNFATIKLERDLHLEDGLEFWVKVGGRVGLTVDTIKVKGKSVDMATAGTLAEIPVPFGVRLNDRVFRTMDSVLMSYAEGFYGDKNKKRIPVDVKVTAYKGSMLEVQITDDEGNTGFGYSDFIGEEALKHPLDEKRVKKQVDRLGTTEYVLRNLECDIEPGVMFPMSEINETRRKACEMLDELRQEAFAPVRKEVRSEKAVEFLRSENRKNAADAYVKNGGNSSRGGNGGNSGNHGGNYGNGGSHSNGGRRNSGRSKISVWVDTLDKMDAALVAGADRIIFGGDRYSSKDLTFNDYKIAARKTINAGKEIAFSTPRIVRENQLKYFEQLFAIAEETGAMLYVHNLGMWQYIKEQNVNVPLWADSSLNIYNSRSVAFWRENGASGVCPSMELNMAQLADLSSVSTLPLECTVQGPIEMMVSEYCTGGSFLGNKEKGACTFNCKEEIYLHDRKDADFRLAGDQFCRMHVLNSADLSVVAGIEELTKMGVAMLRIDCRTYNPEETAEYVLLYRDAIKNAGRGKAMENPAGTTRGHYYRGVL